MNLFLQVRYFHIYMYSVNGRPHCFSHMGSRFHHIELQQVERTKSFSFTKGNPTKNIQGRSRSHYHEFDTLFLDLKNDPGQQQEISDRQVENRMTSPMMTCMDKNDSPPEQYQRMGLNRSWHSATGQKLCHRPKTVPQATDSAIERSCYSRVIRNRLIDL